MKTFLAIPVGFFMAIFFCINANAQLSGYYQQGFEGAVPPAGWLSVDVLDPTYKWSTSTTADFPAAYEGTQSAYCHYTTGAPGEDWLIAPKFTVASGDSLSFRFKLEYFGFPPDSTFILVSTTDSLLTSFTTVLDYFAEGLNYPADSSNWYYKTYSLNAFAGQHIFIAFKYVNEFGDGIFIDKVEIGTRPAKDATVVSIDVDDFNATGALIPRATIKNSGSVAQTFNVNMTMSGGYSSIKPVTLPAQALAQINFDATSLAIGNYTIKVTTLLAGDINNADDTLSKPIKVLEPFVNYGWSTYTPLTEPTFGSAVASVNIPDTSRLFMIGGYGRLTTIPDTYEMDINGWTPKAPLPIECTYAASATANGKIFVFGGRTLGGQQGATQIYDYKTNTWSTGKPMPVPVVTAAFATYKDSLVYIIGGLSDTLPPASSAFNLVQIYNTYTNTWATGTSKPGQAVYSLRAGIIKNKIVVSGGYNPATDLAIGTTYVGIIDTLNPTQITWTQVADHPAGKILRAGTAVSINKTSSLVIFAGGSPSEFIGSVTANTFAFDISSYTWKIGPKKPTARNLFYMAPILKNDSIYLVALGGNPGGAFLDHSEQNEWLNLGPKDRLSVAATSASSNITSNCGPTLVNLNIGGGSLGSGASWKWYSGSCGGTLIGTGAILNNIPVNATTTFFVRAEGTLNISSCVSVKVVINPVPTISITTSPYTSLMPGLSTLLTATAAPEVASNTFVWYDNGAVVPGASGNTLPVNVDGMGTYTARVTTAFGCTALSPTAINIVDSASNKLYISPNPNNGYFSARYYTSSRSYGFLRNLTIYNSSGQQVFTQKFAVTAPYSSMDVGLKKLSKGIYVAVVSDYYGKPLAKGKVMIQ